MLEIAAGRGDGQRPAIVRRSSAASAGYQRPAIGDCITLVFMAVSPAGPAEGRQATTASSASAHAVCPIPLIAHLPPAALPPSVLRSFRLSVFPQDHPAHAPAD